jgi:hypothetical protein
MPGLVVSDRATVDKMLAMGLCVPTDNLELLLSMGFAREFPAISSGDHAHRWIRYIDKGYQQTGATYARVQIAQHAHLTFVSHSRSDAAPPPNKSAAMREANRPTIELIARLQPASSRP